jgi:DNA-directed RNA polymerase subunit omega
MHSGIQLGGIQQGGIQRGVEVNPKELAQRAESLIRFSSNRYLTTVRIAFRAKQRRFDDFDGLLDDSMIKPVQRAIIELSDEQDQPDLLPG